MAIKKLQNNYTTPEQSNRLLELGVPADSADCFISINSIGQDTGILDFPYSEVEKEDFCPCWSVGRLMEIHDICIEDEDAQYGWAPAGDYNYIDYIISRFEEEIIYFFKLEK